MKIINASYKILTDINESEVLKRIEKVARTCYKSEDKITNDSAKKLVNKLIKDEHTAMIEHETISVKIISESILLWIVWASVRCRRFHSLLPSISKKKRC